MKLRNVIFAIILVICIVAVNFAIYWQFFRDTGNETPVVDVQEQRINEFSTMFDNKINYQDSNIAGVYKKENNKDLVYTNYEKIDKVEDKYELNVKIPIININNSNVDIINEEIENIFKNKVSSVMAEESKKAIYSVEYTAYINSNILSLVIKSTLKEEQSPQRVIVKTYNYNVSTNEQVSLAQLIEIRGLQNKYVNEQIQRTVEESNNMALSLKKLGYNVYIRDLNSDIYEIHNTTNYLLGKDNTLYIIYPYGNANYTSELDVVVI